jgi:hypothetical protein
VASSDTFASSLADRLEADEQAEQQADEYRANPVGFVTERLGEHLWSKQREILNSVRDNRLTAVRSCHGIGKTFTVSRAVSWWVATHPPDDTRGVTTAPTFKQVRGVLWQEIRRAHKKSALPGTVNQLEWMINDLLVAQGIKPDDHEPDAFQGVHAKHLLVVLDEGNGVAPELWKAALSLATSEHSRIVVIGNPDDPTSKFAEVCRPGSGWNQIQIGYLDTPNFSGEPVPQHIADKLIGHSWLADARRMYGEGSPVWTSKVLGEFPEQAEDALIKLSLARAAVVRELEPKAYPNTLGVDVARGGSDKTIIYHRRGPVARLHGEHRHDDTMVTAGRVKRALEETGASNAAIDADGLGAGVFDRCAEQGLPVQEIRGGMAARDSEHFANRRAEMYWGLRQRFEDGDIDIPDDDELLAQLTSMKWKVNSRGQILIESKDDMKKRGLPSPDKADALAYVFAGWEIPWTEVYKASSAVPTAGQQPSTPDPDQPPQPPNPWADVYGKPSGGV